jgi:hypothetical protein
VTLRVVVTDIETGDTDEVLIAEGDYILICHDPCYLAGTQVRGKSTHILTVKDHRPAGPAVRVIPAPEESTNA